MREESERGGDGIPDEVGTEKMKIREKGMGIYL